MRVWFDGKLLKGPLLLSPQDRGLILGDGIFETLLVQEGVAVFREDHLNRMETSAEILGIDFPLKAINVAIDGVCKGVVDAHVLRLTLTRGASPRGLAQDSSKPTLFATIDKFDSSQHFKFVSLYETVVRRNEFSPLSVMKTLSYLDNIIAAREAKNFGADDGLMLNTRGNVACTSISNVFLVIDGALVTPKITEGALPGIMRHHVIEAAKGLGIKVKEMIVKPQHVSNATTIFVTNSLRFLSIVEKLNGSAAPFEDLELIKKLSMAVVKIIRQDITEQKTLKPKEITP